MSYSYINNVFPKFENTEGSIYDKLYQQTTLNPIIPYDQMNKKPETFDNTQTRPYSYKSNGFSIEQKDNGLVPLTKPFPYEDKSLQVGGYYSRVAKPGQYNWDPSDQYIANPSMNQGLPIPSPKSRIENVENMSGNQRCDSFLEHVLSCSNCYSQIQIMKSKPSEMMDLLAFIAFGVLILLLLDKMA